MEFRTLQQNVDEEKINVLQEDIENEIVSKVRNESLLKQVIRTQIYYGVLLEELGW